MQDADSPLKVIIHISSFDLRDFGMAKGDNINTMKKFATLFLLCFTFAASTWGQVLLQWNTFGNTGTETTEPSVFNDPNISATSLTLGAGVTGAANSNRLGGSNWFDTGDTNPTTLAESVTGNDYIQFIVTTIGAAFTPTSFVFSWDHSGTGPNSLTLRSSVDGFTADLGSVTGLAASLTSGNTINISGLTGLSGAITFRLYGYGATAAAGTGGFDVASNVVNVQLNGTTVLPIELTNFAAKVVDSKETALSFSTATEQNNAYFSIERSQDGTRFETIGKVTGAGTSTVKQNYAFTDERPLKGINFYRLKQVDLDGQFSYSPVVSVNIGKVGGVRLSPQPVSDRLSVALEQPAVEAATWQVYDFAGRLLQSGALEAESTNFEISTAILTEGTYVLRLVNGQQIITQQFQKN